MRVEELAYKRRVQTKILLRLPPASYWKDRYAEVISNEKSEFQELRSHQ
jgi:hypothetical protein